MRKNSTVAAIIGILLAVSTVPAFAINSPINKVGLSKNATSESTEKISEQKTRLKINLPGNTASKSGEIRETILNTKVENLKNRASNEITRRIASLTHVINKISAIKRLTQIQKDSLTNNIQAEIENLKLLNTKIQADTDIETLREDVKSIVTSYRIYLLYLPQTQIIIAADKLLNTADTFTELVVKLQSRIDVAKSKGEDVSSLETTLADMQAKIADAKTQANNAINAVSILKPTDYPGNKPELQSARTMLQAAHKDLITAKQDAQKIIVELRKMNKNNSTVSPTDITGPNQVNLNVDSIIKNVTLTKDNLTTKSVLKDKSISLKGKIIEWCISNSAMWMDGYFKDSSGEIPVIFKGVNVHHCKDNKTETDKIEYQTTIEAAVMHKEMTDNIGTSVGIVTFLEVNKIIEQ